LVILRLKSIGVSFLTLCSLAPAASLDVFLGGTGFECQQTAIPLNCTSDPTYQWVNDDYVGQTVTGTSFGFINQIDLSLLYEDVLNIGQSQTYNVVINGTTVGDFTVAGLDDSNDHTVVDSFTFAPIAGPDFTVLFRISSPSTPSGSGSLGWYHSGDNSFFTLSDGGAVIPEPGTLSLMLVPAFAGIWAVRRRQR
jgi:hypothetical protein